MRWPHQSILLALWIGVVNLAVLPGVTAGADERQRVYGGSETCQGCHEVQYAQFLANSNKVKSFDSIQKMQKKLTPAEFKECYACHTTSILIPSSLKSSGSIFFGKGSRDNTGVTGPCIVRFPLRSRSSSQYFEVASGKWRVPRDED